jgi:hypothetical protein
LGVLKDTHYAGAIFACNPFLKDYIYSIFLDNG